MRQKSKPKKTIRVKVMGVDDWFGEEDIIKNTPGRTYTVVCESVTGELQKIPKIMVQQRMLVDQ